MVAVALFAPATAIAQQVRAEVTTNLNQRAGPDTRYPVLTVVPQGEVVSIFGCLSSLSWCDGAYRGTRGWFSARYLSIPYDNANFSVASYVRYAHLPTVSFNINSYWDRYYRERQFFTQLSVYASGGSISLSIGSFYQPLSQHGHWVDVRGRYVFVPRVDTGWRPYTEGRWAYTDRYGWMWVSDEPFGWATYHYGRWAYSDRVGWFWVPGTRWAPAWVAWRQSNDYLVWAPLPPEPDDYYGISISVSIGDIPNYYWQGVAARDFQSDNISTVVIGDDNQIMNIINQTEAAGNVTIVNNVVVNNVVDVGFVEQATGEKVAVQKAELTPLADKNGTVSGDKIEIYHPAASELAPVDAPTQVATEEQIARESRTAGRTGGERATDELIPLAPASTTGEAPATDKPPMAGAAAAEGGAEAAPAGETAVDRGPAPQGVEPCPEGTIRQRDGSCAAPARTGAPRAEQVTPDTPSADTPPTQPQRPAAPGQPAPAPERVRPAPEGQAPAPAERPQRPATSGQPAPAPERVRPAPEGRAPAEQPQRPATSGQPAPAPERVRPAPGGRAPAPAVQECPEDQALNSAGVCVPQ